MEKLKKELAAEDERIIRFKTELNAINEGLMKENSIEQYALTIELFSKKYAMALEDIRKNPEDLYVLLHTLIDEIVVMGRPVEAKDRVAGVKKANQQIPDAIHIKLRLPQDILSDMVQLENVGSGQENTSGAR